jgi:hypothetical protein
MWWVSGWVVLLLVYVYVLQFLLCTSCFATLWICFNYCTPAWWDHE